MKAIRVREFGLPEVLKLEDVPDIAPGPNQVLVKVKAAGVNPVDAYVRTGTYARKPALPYTPGSDAAGLVETLGRASPRWPWASASISRERLRVHTPRRPCARRTRCIDFPTG